MYHLLVQLLQPYTLLLLGLVAAVVWAWRSKNSRGRAFWFVSILLGLLYFASTPLAGYLALRSLEEPYFSAEIVPQPDDTIVVLSGSVQRDDESGEQVRVGEDTIYRCLHAAELYKRAGHCRLLLTGGKVDFSEPGPTLAKVMQDFMIELGVQPGDLVLEEQSSTTMQNASFSKKLLGDTQDARIFLVTDAAHMTRARFCFQKEGVTVIPAPCNFGSRRFQLSIDSMLPSPSGIQHVHYATHEWLGIVWYRLSYLTKD
jgi:uncharacterized SAM-binding protein YcdF (DUF218 family)